MPRPHEVWIETGARLHFGLLATHAEIPRRFGGAGVMIESPGIRLKAARATTDAFHGPQADRVARYVETYRTATRTMETDQAAVEPVEFIIESAIPAHSGWGSGTQLGLAVARALSELAGETDCDAIRLATRIGRGRRSGLGAHGFDAGGFLVDAGKAGTTKVAPCVSRLNFPTSWRFLLACPRTAAGLSGTSEKEAFRTLAPIPVATSDRLCRLLLLGILPAIAEQNLELFGDQIHEYGRLVGEHFAQVQGNIIAHPLMWKLYRWLREFGIAGVGQSSWGPGIWAVFPDRAEAEHCRQQITEDARFDSVDLTITAARNHRAAVRITA